jgi:hypothetical protein
MDSRNQMLCGYYCFEEYEFARASLKLMSMDDRYDGLLSLCFPAGNYGTAKGLSIPSFSLHYFTQMREYIEHSGDLSLAKEAYPKLCSVMKTFTDRMEDGCVKSFTGREHWNFYEWTEGLKGHLGLSDEEAFEAALNCLLIIALRNMAYIAERIGEKDEFSRLIPDIKAGIRKRFFNAESGLFRNREDEDSISELVNSLSVLSDVATDGEAERIAELLVSDESPLSPITLSMLCFKYDALLKVNAEKYKDYILGNIHKVADVQDYVNYVQSDFGDPPGLMFMYKASDVLAVDGARTQNGVAIIYEEAGGLPIHVIFDDPSDQLTFERRPSPQQLPGWN